MLILEEFWRGNVSPGEERYRPNSDYSKAFRTMERCEQYMKEHLSEEGLKIFEQFQDAEREVSCLSDCDNFIDGFRMGAMIMMDVFVSYKPKHP
jgi:hypothetical protein